MRTAIVEHKNSVRPVRDYDLSLPAYIKMAEETALEINKILQLNPDITLADKHMMKKVVELMNVNLGNMGHAG